jgi:hypothetical protein
MQMARLIPLDQYAKELGVDCESFFLYSRTLNTPILFRDGVHYIESNLATAELRARGLITTDQFVRVPKNLRSQRDEVLHLGLAAPKEINAAESDVDAEGSDFDDEETEARNDEDGEVASVRAHPRRRTMTKRAKLGRRQSRFD